MCAPSLLNLSRRAIGVTADSGGEDYFTHQAGIAYDFRRDPTPNCGKGCSRVDWQDQGIYSTTVFSREASFAISPPPHLTPPSDPLPNICTLP